MSGVKTWVRVSTFEIQPEGVAPKFLFDRVIDLKRSNRREWLSRHIVYAAMNGWGVQVERDWSW